MSGLHAPLGGMLDVMVEAQRGLTEAEAIAFLATGQLPDLSRDPEDEGVDVDLGPVLLDDYEAVALLGKLALTAAGGFLSSSTLHHTLSRSVTMRFDPSQPRDEDGKWTDGGIGSPAKLPGLASSGVRLTPAKIYKKHADGAVVAVASGGDKRMRWAADRKRFVIEKLAADGGWQETAALTKTAAYADAKKPGRWDEPDAATPTAVEGTDTDKIVPTESLQTPEPEPAVVEPTAKTTSPVVTQLQFDVTNENIDPTLVDDVIAGIGHDFPTVTEGTRAMIVKQLAEGGPKRLGEYFPGANSFQLNQSLWNADGTPKPPEQTRGKWWSHNDAETAVEHFVTHELGHRVDKLLKIEQRNEIFARLSKLWKVSPPTNLNTWVETNRALIQKHVGRYASENYSELLAELWAEYRLAKKPRPAAVAFGDVVTPILGDVNKNGLELTTTAKIVTSVPNTSGAHNDLYAGPRFEMPEDINHVFVDEYMDLTKRDHLAAIAGGKKLTATESARQYELRDALYGLLPAVRSRIDQEAQVTAALEKWQRDNDLPVDSSAKYKRTLARQVHEAFSGKRIGVRVTPKNLENILDDGRFKSQFESGKSKGNNDAMLRANVEASWFGIGQDQPVQNAILTEPEKRPIYGYVMVDGVRPVGIGSGDLFGPSTDALSQYGQIQVVLRDHVRDRTTAMFGDSLNNRHQGIPSPVNQPTWQSFTPAWKSMVTQGLAGPVRDTDSPQFRHGNYAEAQVHGGVSLADIAEVVLPSNPPPALRKKLDDAGVSWRVLTFKTAATNSSAEERSIALRIAREDRQVISDELDHLREKLADYQSRGDTYTADQTSADIKKLTRQLTLITDAIPALEKAVAQ